MIFIEEELDAISRPRVRGGIRLSQRESSLCEPRRRYHLSVAQAPHRQSHRASALIFVDVLAEFSIQSLAINFQNRGGFGFVAPDRFKHHPRVLLLDALEAVPACDRI